jgi:putative membrane-bound dehydrogenase-like protein
VKHAIGVGLFAAVLLAPRWAAGQEGRPSVAPKAPPPQSSEEELQSFRIAEGLAIELAACEPDVIDPVALRFDEDGRMWVVEMRDYPHGPPPGAPPLSTIRVLEDEDNDGRFERSTVFAEGLLFATGLQPWKGGAIVALAGEVRWLADADGDGRADTSETWLADLAAENPQLRANHPTFGPDHRIYVANGLRAVTVRDARLAGGPAVDIRGMDFAFSPGSGGVWGVSGHGQFGLCFDDFGNRFICSNRNPVMHVVLEAEYLSRRPYWAVPAVLHDAAAAGELSRVYPLTRAWTTSNLHSGQFTAACGVEIYRGDALGAEYAGNAFTCEPTGNLVHREALRADGATFRGVTTEADRQPPAEWLASLDEWFRPVDLETGPDGALYVADMYRAVIEHPDWMPTELQSRPDLRDGDDRGRIWRIVPKEGWRRPPRPRLSQTGGAELAASIGHSNGWVRDTAARLLFERQDAAAIPVLREMARRAPLAAGRASALRSLQGLNGLSREDLLAALRDEHPRVQETAVRLAEPLLAGDEEVRQAALALSTAADARLRFQAGLSLSACPGPAAAPALAEIAIRGTGDPWTRRAVVGALDGGFGGQLRESFRSEHGAGKLPDELLADLVGDLCRAAGARPDESEGVEVLTALREVCTARESRRLGLVGVGSFLSGMQSRRGTWGKLLALAEATAPEAATWLADLESDAAEAATRPSEPVADRLESVGFLQWVKGEKAVRALLTVVREGGEQAVRQRALEALAFHPAPEVSGVLLELLPTLTPGLRRAALDAILRQADGPLLLVEALEKGELALVEIDPTRADRLRQSGDGEVRKRAMALWSSSSVGPTEALAAYSAALTLDFDLGRGREVFRKNCTSCHRVAGEGVDVAPDISDSRTKTAAQFLTDILDPNRAIDGNFLSYTVVTNDGQVHVGVIATETGQSLALLQPEGKTVILLKREIEEVRSNGVSLMPVGLEKNVSVQEMADLIGFLKNWRYEAQAGGGPNGTGLNDH